eukprot:COSAG06_NODE_5177_length_3657_cov_4.933671_3_plen_173_part_00
MGVGILREHGGLLALSRLDDVQVRAHLPENGGLCFECFPYVCPEPVLVKRSHLYTLMAQKRLFLRTVKSEALVTQSDIGQPCVNDLLKTSFLCLSRACHGNAIIFCRIKWNEKTVSVKWSTIFDQIKWNKKGNRCPHPYAPDDHAQLEVRCLFSRKRAFFECFPYVCPSLSW